MFARHNPWVRLSVMAIAFAGVVAAKQAQSADETTIVQFLTEGRLKEGATRLQSDLTANPDDHLSRFGLGVCEFLQAVEKLGQDQYRYGLNAQRTITLPLMRFPIPDNPTPEKLTYDGGRKMVQDFMDGLMRAEGTLSKVKPSNLKLRIRVDQVRLDLNGNGNYSDDQSFGQIIQSLQSTRALNFGRVDGKEPPNPEISIAFDDGDVLWLQGYCHAMAAIGEIVLAYDWKDQFERTAHLFYAKVDSPYAYLANERPASGSFSTNAILDVIAFVHTFNFECTQPERMKSALSHMENVIDLSRRSWELINQENDDDAEWLPNINQKSSVVGVRVSPQMQAGWKRFLNEMELILQGKKLAPYWRGVRSEGFNIAWNPDLGINVRRIFTEPQGFDLVLAMQGTGLAPYLEKGEITSRNTWDGISQSFRGNFMFFMVWAN